MLVGNTLTRRIELFDKTIDNLKQSINRIADYIIKNHNLDMLLIDSVGYRCNEFSKGKSQFYIVFYNGLLFDVNNGVIGHQDDIFLDQIIPYKEWHIETQNSYKVELEQIEILKEQMQEW